MNIHFHMLFLDGVYVGEAGSSARFLEREPEATDRAMIEFYLAE